MSFRTNLQYLRSQRNMTQEQLAMLLGVSRQSVTKWESERSYPEMDKLLKLCQIFDCSLDDLVQGNLTDRAPEPTCTAVPSAPPQDVFGYDEHMRRFAWKIPTGIACVLFGVAAAMPFFEEVPNLGSYALETLLSAIPNMSSVEPVGISLIFLGVAISLIFFVPAGLEHSAFVKAHPYLEDFYTEQQKADARRSFAWQLIVGIAVIFTGITIMLLTDGQTAPAGTAGSNAAGLGLSAMLALIGIGCWFIAHGSLMLDRTNIAEYNKNVVDELEIEDIVSSQLEEAHKKALLSAHKQNSRIGAICGVIMLVATITGLALLFGSISAAGDPDLVNWDSNPFWLPWPIGGICCGIVAILMKKFGKK